MLLFATGVTLGQTNFNTKTTSTQVSLEGKTISGYKTEFDFGREEVRKGWWKYAREFGSPLNMRTHYKVTIPSETNDGNVDLLIFTQTTAGDGGTTFFLGLENDTYKDQALSLLIDFKKNFYINELLNEIEQKQTEAQSLCKKYEAAILETEKKKLLDKLLKIEEEVERLIGEVRGVEGM